MARASTPTPLSSASNSSLHSAKTAKKDEFYTQLTDIEKELKHFNSHFKNKVVFCNCDDPEWSGFWKFFTAQFEHLGLVKVIATHYEEGKQSYKLEYFGKDRPTVRTPLQGDGDFRSAECISLLRDCDIVVTNPPFSLFREYVAQLIEHKKQFLIIGNQNALTYREIFALLQKDMLWAGVDNAGTKWFRVPPHYEIKTESRIKVVDGVKYFSMGSIYWFTNLPHAKRNEELDLIRDYFGNESSYPKYDNYDAIEVGKVSEIPRDYFGEMGVPITFMDKYNPEQFKMVGAMTTTKVDEFNFGYPYVGGVKKFARIIIRRIHNDN